VLRDLTIKNYRAFKDFSIDGLARVNLIVGSNNAGKTSFLEAVYLLVNQGSPSVLLQLLDNRGEFAHFPDAPARTEYQMAHLFHNFQLDVDSSRPKELINISSNYDVANSVRFKVVGRRSSSGVQQPGLQIDAAYNAPIEKAGLALDISEKYFFSSDTRFTASRRPPSRYHFVGTELSNFDYLAGLWDQVMRVPDDKRSVIEMLQAVEPRVEDIIPQSDQTAGRFLVRLVNDDPFLSPLPLSSVGEGLRRVFSLAVHMIVSDKGVLLIDEIDTGLYYGVQANVWRLLIAAAQRRNVQIFATTHSWDCIAAFQSALLQGESPQLGQLIRLERTTEGIRKVPYTANDLAIAVREGIEVR